MGGLTGGLRPSRRGLLVGAGCLLAVPATAADGEAPFEARMRLAAPAEPLTVALTLDACPGGFDQRVAAVLAENRIPATIFVTGLWMRRNPEGLAYFLAHPDVFDLENHGYWHIPPVLGRRRIFGIEGAGDLATVRREVERGAEAVRQVTGKTPSWYRAATGFYSPDALADIQARGSAIAAYSLNGDMGASLPAARVARRIGAAANGAVIVSHINQPRRPSGEGVAAGILALRDRGVRFLRLDELTAADMVYSQ